MNSTNSSLRLIEARERFFAKVDSSNEPVPFGYASDIAVTVLKHPIVASKFVLAKLIDRTNE